MTATRRLGSLAASAGTTRLSRTADPGSNRDVARQACGVDKGTAARWLDGQRISRQDAKTPRKKSLRLGGFARDSFARQSPDVSNRSDGRREPQGAAQPAPAAASRRRDWVCGVNQPVVSNSCTSKAL